MKTNKYQKACGWQAIRSRLTDELTESEIELLYDRAFRLYREFAEKHKICKGVRRVHVMSAIAEGALYLPLKDAVGPERALQLLTDEAKPLADAKHDKIERLPAPLFMKAANIITNKMFSEKAGFKRKWVCNSPTEMRYDLLTCPYVDILKEMECPEACGAICIQDVYSFSGLKNGVIFERTETIGTGGTCCNFGFVRPEKKKC